MSANKTSDLSTARILAGFCSFLFPGLGQLLLGRPLAGILFFILAISLWALGAFIIFIGLDSAVYWLCALGGFVTIIPNAIAAYSAANNTPTNQQNPKLEKQTAVKHEQNFSDYADYMAWCKEQGHHPMPPTQYEQMFGRQTY